MPLAAILGVCGLLAASPAAGFAPARDGVVLQETQPAQDAPQPDSSQEPAKPAEPDTRPDQTPAPPTQAPAAESEQQPQSSPPDASLKKPDSKTPASPAAKSKSKSKSKKSGHKPEPMPQPGAGPTKVVVRNGSTADPPVQLSPTLSQQQASSQLQNTNKLLATTDANLKKIAGRQLSPGQQDMVNQARKYIEQAKAAIAAGDLQRAHNLAFKARLLSDDLLKQ